jgi:hypothetical protein
MFFVVQIEDVISSSGQISISGKIVGIAKV